MSARTDVTVEVRVPHPELVHWLRHKVPKYLSEQSFELVRVGTPDPDDYWAGAVDDGEEGTTFRLRVVVPKPGVPAGCHE